MHFAIMVIAVGKGPLQPLHPVGQITLWSPYHQMEMVRHYAKTFKDPTTLLAGLK